MFCFKTGIGTGSQKLRIKTNDLCRRSCAPLLLFGALAAIILVLSGCAADSLQDAGIYALRQEGDSASAPAPELPEASALDPAPELPEASALDPAPELPEASALDQTPDFPPYAGQPYAAVHDNLPYFSEGDLTEQSFEAYGELDELGRCGVAYACIGTDIMPTKERGIIGSIKPTGWHTVKYPGIIEDNYLYNRCHLIGYQLSGENANERNLITGTRYMNIQGMLPLESIVADYVKDTGNHVLYRVTPIFEGANLLASGVLMEAKSVEDQGEGVSFCVYAYNVQPGILIDYATGESSPDPDAPQEESTDAAARPVTYILNTNTKKFHYPSCRSVEQMSGKNKKEFTGSRDEAISQGFVPCRDCNP